VLDASALSVYTQVYVHSQVGATASDLELVVDAMSRVAIASTFAKLCQLSQQFVISTALSAPADPCRKRYSAASRLR